MRIWYAIALMISMASPGQMAVHAADEQRQAYDKMVEEAVKEADDYVQRKQAEAAKRTTEKKMAEQQKAAEEARKAAAAEGKKTVRGVIVRTPSRYYEPEAVTLPSGPDMTGEGGAVAIVTPDIPPLD